MHGTILSGTLAASGYGYVLQTSAHRGGRYEVVVTDKETPLLSRSFEPTKIGYIEGRKWLNTLQDMGPFEIAKLAQASPPESESAAFG
jgi:hypothetical protein